MGLSKSTEMLQAKIFKASEISVNGEALTVAQLTEATIVYNASASSGLVVFDDFPGPSTPVQLDRVAATAKLHMDGEYAIATVKFIDTPLGRVATQLYKAGVVVQVVPVTTTVTNTNGPKLQIRQLIIPTSPAFAPSDTPLRIVQSWVDGVKYWPMFELKEHKY